MVINNHKIPENMRDLLDIKLLSQRFQTTSTPGLELDNGKLIAQIYSTLENCISVLSDLKAGRSYIYYGAIADQLGLYRKEAEIGSIWEDELLSRVNPEDLQKKYRLELQFFQLLNSIEPPTRADYQVITKLRIRNSEGRYMQVKHRLLYIGSSGDGSIWLALCLYNRIYEHPEYEVPKGVIVNTQSGKIIDYDHHNFINILSQREKEVLQLIKHGHRSKEIAGKLSLSINTINRHRQNIFQKLNVTSALEACKVAERTGLLY